MFRSQITIVHLFVAPPHLNYHDVDMTFLTGMLAALPRSISGEAEMQIREKLEYPKQIKYGKGSEMLPSLAMKLQLRTTLEVQKVQRHLEHLLRRALETKADFNSAIRSVITQLKLAKHVTCDTVCHQIAGHMVENYQFYLRKMTEYLKYHDLLFSSYIVNLYKGNIWADEFMLGAMARMFDIKITIVSPAYDDIWNVFHDSGLPHVVIVSNGGDFGDKRGVTHFSATTGFEDSWKCIGADLEVGEMGRRSGYEKGLDYTVHKFYDMEKSKLLDSTREVAVNIQELCQDLNRLCVRRDKIYEQMSQIRINVDDFKQFDTFFYEVPATQVEAEPVHEKSHKKKKEHRKEKVEKSKKSAKSCAKFPDDVRSKLMSDAIADMDREREQVTLPQESNVEAFTRSRPGGCRIKNASRPQFPLLPESSDTVPENPEQHEVATITVKDLKQWVVSEEPINPYNFNLPESGKTDEVGIVDQRPISPKAEFVVTEQLQRSQDEIFTRK